MSEMRIVYRETLRRMMAEDPRIVIVEADLARSLGSQPLRDDYPDRFFDVGIAEQNMVTVSAGMAIGSSLIPFAHTFAPFMTRRVADQVAISVCYAQANVKLIGSDPGIAAEINGATHQCYEDIAIMRAFSNMMVVDCADEAQLACLLPQVAAHEGPVYLRLFRKVLPEVYTQGCTSVLGKADVLRAGNDVTLIAEGICVYDALQAAEQLATEGIDARVINMHTIKPLDRDAVLAAACETGAIVTCENHNVVGGLGAAVCECVCESRPVPVVRVGVPDRFGEVGKLDYLKQAMGMDVPSIVRAAHQALALKV